MHWLVINSCRQRIAQSIKIWISVQREPAPIKFSALGMPYAASRCFIGDFDKHGVLRDKHVFANIQKQIISRRGADDMI